MKPAPAFTLGLITGFALFAAFNFSRTPTQSSALPHPPTPPPHTQPTSTSSASDASTQPSSTPELPQDSLESALREIRDVGMIVIPQEAARVITPSMISSNPDPAVRAILQLDDKEVAALSELRGKFMKEFHSVTDAHIQITGVKDGAITAIVPAFEEERQKLIDKLRVDSLAALDADSAAVFGYINLDRVLEYNHLGTRNIAATFTPTSGGSDYRMELKSDEKNGSTRSNFRMQQTIPQKRLRTEYPSLVPHLPAPPSAQPAAH